LTVGDDGVLGLAEAPLGGSYGPGLSAGSGFISSSSVPFGAASITRRRLSVGTEKSPEPCQNGRHCAVPQDNSSPDVAVPRRDRPRRPGASHPLISRLRSRCAGAAQPCLANAAQMLPGSQARGSRGSRGGERPARRGGGETCRPVAESYRRLKVDAARHAWRTCPTGNRRVESLSLPMVSTFVSCPWVSVPAALSPPTSYTLSAWAR